MVDVYSYCALMAWRIYGCVDDHRMDQSHTVSWDPGIADSRTLSACYDCLCLMTLFRTVMYLARYWVVRIVLLAGCVLYVRRVGDCRNMAADGAALAEVKAGITFGVELYVPWDAPEAVVDISSEGVMPLRNVPDVIGLVGRRESAAESRVLQGRNIHSVRVLVPDCRGVDQNFHDVTIVDMGEVPESSVSILELSALSQQWPRRSLATWGGVRRNWKRCVRRLNSVSVRVGRAAVFTVGA